MFLGLLKYSSALIIKGGGARCWRSQTLKESSRFNSSAWYLGWIPFARCCLRLAVR